MSDPDSTGQAPSTSIGQAQDSNSKKVGQRGQVSGGRVAAGLQKNASALQHALTKRQVSQKLEARPEQNELLTRNILRSDSQGSASRIQAAQRKLQHHMTTDKLGHLLEKRAEVDSLAQQNILTTAPTIAPAIAASSRALQKNLARANLYHALKHRPTVQELQQRGIYGEVPYIDSQEVEDGYEGGDADYLYHAQEETEALGRDETKHGDPTSFTSDPSHHTSGHPENSYSGDLSNQQQHSAVPHANLVSYQTAVPSSQQVVENGDGTNGEVKGGAGGASQVAYQRRSKNFHLTRILLKFVASMADAGEISLQQKGTLKDLIVDQDLAILAVAECFDAEHDLNDLKDSLIHLASSRQ